MKEVLKIIFICYFLFVFTVTILNLNASITFGKGLGDIYNLIQILILTVIYSLVYSKLVKKNSRNKVSTIVFCIILFTTVILIILKLTILRGAEYTWNGKLFLE